MSEFVSIAIKYASAEKTYQIAKDLYAADPSPENVANLAHAYMMFEIRKNEFLNTIVP